jgi:hypothetical protein
MVTGPYGIWGLEHERLRFLTNFDTVNSKPKVEVPKIHPPENLRPTSREMPINLTHLFHDSRGIACFLNEHPTKMRCLDANKNMILQLLLVLAVGVFLRADAFQQLPSHSSSKFARRQTQQHHRSTSRRQVSTVTITTSLYAMIPILDESIIDPMVSAATAALSTTSMSIADAAEAATTADPSNTEEVLKTVAIALTLGGGLIPATISANQQMISALSGRKGYNDGKPMEEDDPNNTFDPTAGKGINPTLRQYVIDSGASGPPLPKKELLFAADNIPLVDVIAVLGRIKDTNSIVDWRSLPSATRPGTSTTNPPMWLPRNAFKVLIRQAKFVAWPTDPKTGQPVGGEQLKQAELSRISKPNALIGDAALDAVFDSWAWGASIATPDKVENTLKLFQPSPTELDLDAFVAAAIRGRECRRLPISFFLRAHVSRWMDAHHNIILCRFLPSSLIMFVCQCYCSRVYS